MALSNTGGIAVMLVDNLGEGGAWEQTGILGIEAKYDLVEVARQPFRVGGVLLHVHPRWLGTGRRSPW